MINETLAEKVVLVTGAGRGLGRALAVEFARQNCVVVGFGRDAESLQGTSDLIAEGSFIASQVDVSDFDAVANAIAQAREQCGQIDILFNNAAVYPKVNFLREPAQAWLDAIIINLGGVANCCKAVIPQMIENNFGRIYNVGSWADIAPIPNSSAYATSKGGLHALTKSIAADIAHLNLNIEVHEWIPGHLNTRMSEFTGTDPKISAEWAVKIACAQNISSKSCLFENDREWIPPVGIKERIKKKLFFWRR